jgi:hypothetical protein
MMMTRLLVVAALLGGAPATSGQAATTYDYTKAGMNCAQNSAGDMECNYHVGRSLHFGIAGVGKPDASIYFYSASFEGDYFAVMGLSHGCVVVRPGKALGQKRAADLAFVSPRNGKVYASWQACQSAE